ncbi:MAG: signal recognition particle-docking protein FtsY [Vampirovibrionales bacterium]|nr:signal recognition particle-docking protein FtsY [Vampirovibrionales bacterium]
MFNWLKPKASSPEQVTAPILDAPPQEASPALSPFARLKQALAATGRSLWGGAQTLIDADRGLDEDALDAIEETLLRADVGLETTLALLEPLRRQEVSPRNDDELRDYLKTAFLTLLRPFESGADRALRPAALTIYLVTGVNGAGKTTFIGKLAHRLTQSGQRVVIGAGDTFRAAAENQLAIWAERAHAQLVRRDGADPASVVFEAIEEATRLGADAVILDTAGRLQNKYNLMEELRKIAAVIEKARPADSDLRALLVLDATTGQNALRQAEAFKEAVTLTGVVLTKLDGSSKGGVALSVAREFGLPVQWVGVGEKIDDLQPFNAEAFVEALFSDARAGREPAAGKTHV